MTFTHIPQNLIELETQTINGRRYYVTPNGNYPSITTVFSAFPNPKIDEWRAKVGDKEADRISKVATDRGTLIHSLCEYYLKNEEYPESLNCIDRETFFNFKKILNRIDNIHGLEVPLYSDRLKVAGRTDCIGEFDGILSLIDFKTSKKEKREDWIHHYFLQATFYALCYYELTNIKIKQLAILIAVDAGENQVFVKPIKDYIQPLIEKINYFHKNYT